MMKVQGVLRLFPKYLIHNAPLAPLFWIEIPDLAPMPLFTGPLICIEPKPNVHEKGLLLMADLDPPRIVPYVLLNGPFAGPTLDPPTIEPEVYRLYCWLSETDKAGKQPSIYLKKYDGPIEWKDQSTLLNELGQQAKIRTEAAMEQAKALQQSHQKHVSASDDASAAEDDQKGKLTATKLTQNPEQARNEKPTDDEMPTDESDATSSSTGL
jgi:hypothetical protein